MGLTALLAALCLAATTQAQALSPERPLNHYAALDNKQNNQYSPRIVTDGKGNWLSMWKTGTGENFDPAARLSFASSTTTGSTWGPMISPPFLAGDSFRADLAYAGDDKWVVVWLDELSSHNPVRRVYASVSEDVGQTWSTPTVIHEPASTNSFPAAHVHVKSDGAGNLMALWMEFDPAPTLVYYTSHSPDFGETWTTPVRVTGLDSSPSQEQPVGLTAAGENTWLMLYLKDWVYSVAKSEDNGATWADLGRLFAKPATHRRPSDVDIAYHNGRTVIAAAGAYIPGVWPPENPRAIFVFSSNDSQTTFTSAAMIDRQADVSAGYAGGNVNLATDAAGNWLLATKIEGPASAPVKLWHTDDLTTTWTLVHELTHGANAEVDIAGAGDKDFAAVMTHYGSEASEADLDILALNSSDVNAWSDPVYVNDGATSDFPLIYDYNVDMAAGNNLIIATWAANYVSPPGGSFSDSTWRIMFSRSLDNGRTWEPARKLSDLPGHTSSIRFLPSGTWECTWETDLFSSEFYRSTSTNNGLTWSAPVAVTGMPEKNKHIKVAENGEWIRTRTEVTMDTNTRIYTLNTYAEVSSDSGATWHSTVLIQSESRAEAPVATDYTGDPAIVTLGNGRLAILGKNTYKGRDVPLDANRILAFHAFLSESSDYGRTWSTPQTVTNSTRLTQISPQPLVPMVASNGRIVIAWSEFGDNETSTGNDSDILFRSKTFGALTAARDWSLYE